ncbi:hypothetical protein [Nitratiruptor sp. SB155-2]|uniref:hypothetical protein n=1 Tax=Nitratiruptor sp. (strain SB155-2) TaxID=387092 RepID=UPI0001587236|nr:hypothetical protein [Nitratiruptor sp. SB155-2]BAF70663.1 conserved hypothetical protein [Nitratiruptor sp. SB155-2]
MSDVEKLNRLDPEEVFQKTYIPHKVFKKLVEQDFEGLGNKTKVFGLIKILEDRFDLDLSELKESAQSYFQTHQENHTTIQPEDDQKRNKLPIGVLVFVAIVVAGTFLWFANPKKDVQHSGSEVTHEAFLDNNVTQKVISQKEIHKEQNKTLATHSEKKDEIKTAISETNESKKMEKEEEKVSFPTITFIPKKKLWIGIMYLDDYKRKNYITSKPVEINTSRDQLIMTGHGLFRVDIDGNITDYKERSKMRFLYRTGELEKIDKKTFDLYNKGHKW